MKTLRIAFTGKGGVGKTALSAAFVRLLSERFPEKRILAVDADPAVGLSTALDMEPPLTLDEVRMRITQSVEQGETRDAIELLSEARFHLEDCIAERGNVSFFAIGRPEAAGCYCKVNAYLKQVLEMLSGNYDFVVIDGEAGVEQINRRVMETVDQLVLVSDGSKKGIHVISTIREVAERLVACERAGVIFNRTAPGFDPAAANVAPVLAVIGDDPAQSGCDMRGESVFGLPADSALLAGAAKALDAILADNEA